MKGEGFCLQPFLKRTNCKDPACGLPLTVASGYVVPKGHDSFGAKFCKCHVC